MTRPKSLMPTWLRVRILTAGRGCRSYALQGPIPAQSNSAASSAVCHLCVQGPCIWGAPGMGGSLLPLLPPSMAPCMHKEASTRSAQGPEHTEGCSERATPSMITRRRWHVAWRPAALHAGEGWEPEHTSTDQSVWMLTRPRSDLMTAQPDCAHMVRDSTDAASRAHCKRKLARFRVLLAGPDVQVRVEPAHCHAAVAAARGAAASSQAWREEGQGARCLTSQSCPE